MSQYFLLSLSHSDPVSSSHVGVYWRGGNYLLNITYCFKSFVSMSFLSAQSQDLAPPVS